MSILDAPGVSPKKFRLSNLLTRLASTNTLPIPDVAPTSDIPTVTWNSTTSYASAFQVVGPQSGLVTEVGSRGTWNPVNGSLPVSNVAGLDFFHDGDTTLEFQCITNAGAGGTSNPFWIWVNGKPVAATPDTSGPTTSATFFVKLVFPSVARRRIEFFAPSTISAWFGVITGNAGLITPAPRRPIVAFVGDSFFAGSAGTPEIQCAPFLISRMLGVECFSKSYGGTGFVNAGAFNTFGSATRVSQVSVVTPELIVMQGSVNDDGLNGGVQAAATAAFSAYATAFPAAKIIVFGPQPSNAVDTISANRAANIAALNAAVAVSSANVLAFHDEVGSASGLPAAYNSGTSYAEGSLVTSLGSVWKFQNGGTALSGQTPGTSRRWALQTYAYTGTGKVGTTTGDGTRDTYLFSDGVHPMPAASVALAIRLANQIRSDLKAAVG